MSEPIALVDMDGTLCDFNGAMNRDLAKLAAPGEMIDWSTDWCKARRQLIRRQPGWWENLKPIDMGLDVLDVLIKSGFQVHILTKGPFNTHSAWSE